MGLGEEGRVSSKIMRPPGGASTIFSADSGAPSTPVRTNYRMASNFELGDEQPTGVQMNNRRRSKPSVNPLTGELVGNFSPAPSTGASSVSTSGSASPDMTRKDSESNSIKSGSNESVNTVDSASEMMVATQNATPVKNRIPPGGYSTPLW